MMINEAIKLHQAGDLKKALLLYKQILENDPNNAQVQLLVGKLYLKAKKQEAALPFLNQANKLMPNSPEILNSLGKAFMLSGQSKDAKDTLDNSIRIDRAHTPSLLNLAKLHKLENKKNEAIALYKKVIQIKPNSVAALNNLANMYQESNKVDEAGKLFYKAVQLSPSNSQLRVNYANILQRQNKLDDAIKEYEAAISIKPDLAVAHKSLAEVYAKVMPYQEALKRIEALFKTGVKDPGILLSAGILALRHGNAKLAIKLFQKNCELFPENFDSHYQLGISLHQIGYSKKALPVYDKAYQLNKKSDILLYAMAKLHADLNEEEKALSTLKEAATINPENNTVQHEIIRTNLNACNWDNRDADEALLTQVCNRQIETNSQSSIPYLNLNYFKQQNEFLFTCAKHISNTILQKVKSFNGIQKYSHAIQPKEKLRIGYISPDFRDHPTGRVVIDFLSMHNKEQFEVYCFSIIADNPKDTIQKKFKENSDYFISLYNIPTHEAAEKINQCEIDILIDLAGYTTYSRTEILALQPAPIQCQMIGFPGSMGAPFIQYIIGDKYLTPAGHEPFYTEKIVRMPFSFPGSVLDVNNQLTQRSDFNLPEDAFVYCCFNSQYKFSPEVFDVWMHILKQVPNAILLVKGGGDIYKQNILKESVYRGVEESRIYFAESLPFPDYMARNKVCDLFLDTFFYSAGSTAINALQTGLPVLTYAGNTNASRMGAAIVHAAGLNGFICNSIEEYTQQAIHYGNNPLELSKIKEEFGKKVLDTDLFNAKKYVSNLEEAYLKMWANLLSKQ